MDDELFLVDATLCGHTNGPVRTTARPR